MDYSLFLANQFGTGGNDEIRCIFCSFYCRRDGEIRVHEGDRNRPKRGVLLTWVKKFDPA
jgi:hypothetical protein